MLHKQQQSCQTNESQVRGFICVLSLFKRFIIFPIVHYFWETSSSHEHVLCFPTTCSNWRSSRLAPPLFPPTNSGLASRVSAHLAPRGRVSRTASRGLLGNIVSMPYESIARSSRNTTFPSSPTMDGRSP